MAATVTTASHIVLAQRPKGSIDANTFTSKSVPIPEQLEAEHVLVRVDWLSLDPAMRGWLNDTRSYIPPVQIGETMRAQGLGTVFKSNSTAFRTGDVVSGVFGWCNYAVMKADGLEKHKAPDGANELDFLGPLGSTGLTAYFGLLDVGKIKAGETLVVSGAAGAVGSMVCQIGKLKGARVIGLAGSADKVTWLEEELGVDKALNYKSPTFVNDFKKHVGYLDVFFDNVGGEILDLCLGRLKKGARIVLCGAISAYNEVKPRGLQAYLSLISQRAKIEGFIVFDYQAQYPVAIKDISQWIKEGKIKRKFHVVEGLDKCPEHVNMLYSGGNTGKLVVKIFEGAQSRL